MKATHCLSAALVAWGSLVSSAIATPEIASGDGIVNASAETCLDRTDNFVSTLDVSVESGQMDRTGYFNDGSFRILCYPSPYNENSKSEAQSLVVIFAAHGDDIAVADTFVQVAVSQIADQ